MFELIDKPDNTYAIIISITLLMVLLSTVIIKNFYKNYYKNLFRYFQFTGKTNFLEEVILNSRARFISTCASILCISTAIYAIIHYSVIYDTGIKLKIYLDNQFLQFLIILAGVAVYFILKINIIKILGKIFEQNQIATQNINYTTNIIQILGIILFPFSVLITFSVYNILSISLIIIISIIIIISVCCLYIILLNNLVKQKMLNFYTILYLFIFEILPFLFLAKIFE